MFRYIVSRLATSVAMVLLATLVIFLIANTVFEHGGTACRLAMQDPAQAVEIDGSPVHSRRRAQQGLSR